MGISDKVKIGWVQATKGGVYRGATTQILRNKERPKLLL
jgi:hypothetical protein